MLRQTIIYNEKIQNHLLTHGMNETNQTKHFEPKFTLHTIALHFWLPTLLKSHLAQILWNRQKSSQYMAVIHIDT